MTKEERKMIKKFFAYLPISHAIPRANEALAIKTVRLTPPVLDLGCGDGKFALLAFGRKKIDVGLDKGRREIIKARKAGVYKDVVNADAVKMPFENNSFRSVITNSALEHIEDLGQVLGEIARILKKGGILVLTVPTPLVSDYQFWARFIPGYAEFKRKLWRHINYFEEGEWRQQLKKAGFKTDLIKRTNSQSAIIWADIFFPLWFVGPMKPVVSFLEKREVFGFDKKGATLLIVAKKK